MTVSDNEKDDFILQILINVLVLLFFSILPIIFMFSYSFFILYLVFLVYFIFVIIFKNKGSISPLINQVTIILGTLLFLGIYFTLVAKSVDFSTVSELIEVSFLVFVILILINRKWQVYHYLKKGFLIKPLSLKEAFFYYVGNLVGILSLIFYTFLLLLYRNYSTYSSNLLIEIITKISNNYILSIGIMIFSIFVLFLANFFIVPRRPRLPPDFIRPTAYELAGATISDLFNSLPQVFISERSKSWKGIIQFTTLGYTASYAIYIQNEICQVKMEIATSPDITITAWENTFLALLIGKLNPQDAFFKGYLKVDNTNLLLKCLTMFNFQSMQSIIRKTKNLT